MFSVNMEVSERAKYWREFTFYAYDKTLYKLARM